MQIPHEELYEQGMPSQAALQNMLAYNPNTGILKWKEHAGAKHMVGRRAGYPRLRGSRIRKPYVVVSVWGRRYVAARLIMMLLYGKVPHQVVHVNGDTLDDRQENLDAYPAPIAREVLPVRRVGEHPWSSYLSENGPGDMKLREVA